MKISIETPAKRSLTPNEQRVYKLLQEGAEPSEIARQLHMALRISNLANRHDVPPDTVMGLIASIREKGREIPKINKEEDTMAKGQKTPVEKVHEIGVLKDEGKTQRQIAEITGVPFSTVGKVCARLGSTETKEEPAPSDNDTSSNSKEENISTINIVPEIPADVNPCDEISDENFCCEVTGDTDMEAYLAEREKFFAERRAIPNAVREVCIEKMEELRGKIAEAQADIRAWAEEFNEISSFLAGSTFEEEGQQ